MTTRPHILFVSHSATLNGATILLLHLLRWLRHNTDIQIDILVNGSGELLPEFRSLAPTSVWRNSDRVFGWFPRSSRRATLESYLLRLQMLGKKYDLIYLNTFSVASHLRALIRLSGRVLWHIHELQYGLYNGPNNERTSSLLALATRVIAVSGAVQDVLVRQFEVPEHKVDLIHEFVPVPSEARCEREPRRRQIRQQLGWPQDAFVVGGCGALGWRKGTDVFLQVARALKDADDRDQIRFLWVGGGSTDESLRFEHDVRLLGLRGHCQRIPATQAVADYYHAMDVFALTSREDPFPLVMLEAGASCLPIICFAGSGGAPEFTGDNAGLTAPYLNITAFTRHVQKLQHSPALCRQFGTVAAEKVHRYYALQVQAPKILASIERCLSTRISRVNHPA